MAPPSRSNQPPGPGGTSSGAGGASGGASVEYTEGAGAARPGGRGTPPPPPGASAQQQHPQRPPQQQQQQHVQYYLTAPVTVYNLRGKKRRKRKKYSRGLKFAQRSEDGLTLAGRRLGDAIESGFKSYRKRRTKSWRRKKDGPIRDILPNTSRGVSRFLNVGSDIPYDITRKINSKRFGKQVRDTVWGFAQTFGFN